MEWGIDPMNWLILAACLAGGPLHEMDTTQIDTEMRIATQAELPFTQRLTEAAQSALGWFLWRCGRGGDDHPRSRWLS